MMGNDMHMQAKTNETTQTSYNGYYYALGGAAIVGGLYYLNKKMKTNKEDSNDFLLQ